MDLTDTEATAGSHASSVEEDTVATAKATVADVSSLVLTADDGVPSGNPCATTTRKNGQLIECLSVHKVQYGSLACRYRTATFSLKTRRKSWLSFGWLRLNTRKAKCVSGSRVGSIDGWIILVLR